MTVFVLVFLLYTKAGPHLVPGYFPDRFNCEQAEGELADILEADKTVTGWTVVDACVAVGQPQKV